MVKNSLSFQKGIIKKIFYGFHDYELVDNNGLSWVMSQKNQEKSFGHEELYQSIINPLLYAIFIPFPEKKSYSPA